MFDEFKRAIDTTFGEWIEKYNGLIDKLDGLPIPTAFGSNTTMSYLKFANGKIFMWGRIDCGTKYPCTDESGNGYCSATVDMSFPVPLVKDTPTVIPYVQAYPWSNVWFLSRTVTYTGLNGFFYSQSMDKNANNKKIIHLLVVGDWK